MRGVTKQSWLSGLNHHVVCFLRRILGGCVLPSVVFLPVKQLQQDFPKVYIMKVKQFRAGREFIFVSNTNIPFCSCEGGSLDPGRQELK